MVLLIRRWLVLALGSMAASGCTHLLFHPMEEHVNDPEALGIEAEDVFFESADGIRLHAWFLPAQTAASKGSVLFLHGNAENISTHLASVWWLPDRGFDVLLLDYRGYGRSEGSPTLDGVHRDARAALDTLRRRAGVDAERIAIFGQSLGGAVAINLVASPDYQDGVRALVVEGVPVSFRTRARELLGDWWLTWALQWPLSLTISDDYRPIDAVDQVAPIPLLIVHGGADTIIPPDHGRRLFEAANEPRALWVVPGAQHIHAFAHPQWRERLVEYLEARLGGEAAGSAGRVPREGRSPSHSADPVQ